MQYLTRVTSLFPRTDTAGPNAAAVAIACLVLCAEIIDEHFAVTTHDTVVLIRPLLGFTRAVSRKIPLRKERCIKGKRKQKVRLPPSLASPALWRRSAALEVERLPSAVGPVLGCTAASVRSIFFVCSAVSRSSLLRMGYGSVHWSLCTPDPDRPGSAATVRIQSNDGV